MTDRSPTAHFDALANTADDDIDLARAALALARGEYPDLREAACLDRLDRLGAGILASLEAGAEPAAALRQVLFERFGLRGNRQAYHDARNSYLNEVLERRLGIPISLALVMLETGWRAGLALAPVAFPAHFVVRLTVAGEHRYLDPFDGGAVLGEAVLLAWLERLGGDPAQARAALPAALQPASRRELLARMLRNLLAIHAEADDLPRALAVADLAVRLQPLSAALLRTRGLLYARIEHVPAALGDLRAYLAMLPEAPDAPAVRATVARLAGAARRSN